MVIKFSFQFMLRVKETIPHQSVESLFLNFSSLCFWSTEKVTTRFSYQQAITHPILSNPFFLSTQLSLMTQLCLKSDNPATIKDMTTHCLQRHFVCFHQKLNIVSHVISHVSSYHMCWFTMKLIVLTHIARSLQHWRGCSSTDFFSQELHFFQHYWLHQFSIPQPNPVIILWYCIYPE